MALCTSSPVSRVGEINMKNLFNAWQRETKTPPKCPSIIYYTRAMPSAHFPSFPVHSDSSVLSQADMNHSIHLASSAVTSSSSHLITAGSWALLFFSATAATVLLNRDFRSYGQRVRPRRRQALLKAVSESSCRVRSGERIA